MHHDIPNSLCSLPMNKLRKYFGKHSVGKSQNVTPSKWLTWSQTSEIYSCLKSFTHCVVWWVLLANLAGETCLAALPFMVLAPSPTPSCCLTCFVWTSIVWPMSQVFAQTDVSHDLFVFCVVIYMIAVCTVCFNVTNAKLMLCKDLTQGCWNESS